jgi:predicted nuclease of predicted toxin-antitoxin system
LREEEFEFAKLMMDIMIPPEISEALRGQGYDVLEARELPPEIYQDDRLLLEEATKQGRVLVTCNYSDPSLVSVVVRKTLNNPKKDDTG